MTNDLDKLSGAADDREDALFDRVAEILDAARAHVSRTVDTTMVQAYWLIGHEIVEVEQGGEARAEYGEAVVKRLSARLTERYGRGFSYPSVKRMKQFYLIYRQGSALPEARSQRTPLDAATTAGGKGSAMLSLFPSPLGWTHYIILMKLKDEGARAFYEIEGAREGWTTRDLERPIASLLYERLANSRDKEGVLDRGHVFVSQVVKQRRPLARPTGLFSGGQLIDACRNFVNYVHCPFSIKQWLILGDPGGLRKPAIRLEHWIRERQYRSPTRRRRTRKASWFSRSGRSRVESSFSRSVVFNLWVVWVAQQCDAGQQSARPHGFKNE